VNNRGEPLIPQCNRNHAIAAEAFAHFSLDMSHGREMVTDIQGVLRPCSVGRLPSISTTDPQIVSTDRCFGDADLGEQSMQRFRSLHRCNELCRILRLSSSTNSPRAPLRTRLPISTRLNRPAVQQSRPSVRVPPPEWSNQPRRGRSSQQQRQQQPCVELRDDETVKADQLLFLGPAQPKKLIFIGECTHSFSAASAMLVSAKLRADGGMAQSLAWWSTSLDDPASDRLRAERQAFVSILRRRGVQILSGIDATCLHLLDSAAVGFHGAVWVMAFPRESTGLRRSSSGLTREHMQQQVIGFVKSAAPRIDLDGGKIYVVLMAHQHLAWKLPSEIITARGNFIREVFCLDLEAFRQAGYQARYGDARDGSRDPTYHKLDQVVIAQWRVRQDGNDKPGGMADPRVRSISSSHSRSASRGRNSSTSRQDRSSSRQRI